MSIWIIVALVVLHSVSMELRLRSMQTGLQLALDILTENKVSLKLGT